MKGSPSPQKKRRLKSWSWIMLIPLIAYSFSYFIVLISLFTIWSNKKKLNVYKHMYCDVKYIYILRDNEPSFSYWSMYLIQRIHDTPSLVYHRTTPPPCYGILYFTLCCISLFWSAYLQFYPIKKLFGYNQCILRN
jgi:hypothetical protein